MCKNKKDEKGANKLRGKITLYLSKTGRETKVKENGKASN